MAYQQYSAKINTEYSKISEIINKINEIDFDSIWEGPAKAKQINNLKAIINNKNTQINQLKSLSSALVLIDKYNTDKKSAEDYQSTISALNPQDTNYNNERDRLTRLKNNAITSYESLKKEIDTLLDSITTRYSEEYTNLPTTEVTNTVDTFLNAEKTLNTITDSLSIELSTGHKVRTDGEGNIISIDKPGDLSTKEATPGQGAQRLFVYHNGTRLGDDAYITIKKGETIRLTVNLTDNAGNVELLKRTSADGQSNWRNYFSQYSEPSVNRYKPETFQQTDYFEWVITADKVTQGYVELSETTFHSTPLGREFKSMYGIHIKVVP